MHPWTAGNTISVRRALDPSLTADTLSDELIEDDVFLLPALGELERRDPDALTYSEQDDPTEYNAVRIALCFLVAAEIAPVLPVITGERLGDRQYSRERWDGAAMAARLRGKAAAALASYLEEDGLARPPLLFTVAHGYRGR